MRCSRQPPTRSRARRRSSMHLKRRPAPAWSRSRARCTTGRTSHARRRCWRGGRRERERAAIAAGSLSRRERGGVRGYKLPLGPTPLTPTLSPTELGYTRVRSLRDVAEVGNIRLRLGRGSSAVPRSESAFPRFSAAAIHRLRIEGLVAVERQRHRTVLAERHHAIEARAPAGMAGAGALLLDLDPDRVLVAVNAHLEDALGVAGLLALAPQLLARAAEVPGVTGCDGARKRLGVHVRDHQELARLRVGRDASD